MDRKRKCIVDGCENLGDWNKIVNGIVYRKRMCKKHIKMLTNGTLVVNNKSSQNR